MVKARKVEQVQQEASEHSTLSANSYRAPSIVDIGPAELLTQGEIINGPHDGNTPTNPAHFKKR